MDSMQTMVRTQAAIDDAVFLLAQGQDLDQLKRRVEAGLRAGGAFVDFTVEGNRQVSVLISASTRVVFSVETVHFDGRDTGEEDLPYSSTFDL